jgi:hypothetical protein
LNNGYPGYNWLKIDIGWDKCQPLEENMLGFELNPGSDKGEKNENEKRNQVDELFVSSRRSFGRLRG